MALLCPRMLGRQAYRSCIVQFMFFEFVHACISFTLHWAGRSRGECGPAARCDIHRILLFHAPSRSARLGVPSPARKRSERVQGIAHSSVDAAAMGPALAISQSHAAWASDAALMMARLSDFRTLIHSFR